MVHLNLLAKILATLLLIWLTAQAMLFSNQAGWSGNDRTGATLANLGFGLFSALVIWSAH